MYVYILVVFIVFLIDGINALIYHEKGYIFIKLDTLIIIVLIMALILFGLIIYLQRSKHKYIYEINNIGSNKKPETNVNIPSIQPALVKVATHTNTVEMSHIASQQLSPKSPHVPYKVYSNSVLSFNDLSKKDSNTSPVFMNTFNDSPVMIKTNSNTSPVNLSHDLPIILSYKQNNSNTTYNTNISSINTKSSALAVVKQNNASKSTIINEHDILNGNPVPIHELKLIYYIIDILQTRVILLYILNNIKYIAINTNRNEEQKQQSNLNPNINESINPNIIPVNDDNDDDNDGFVDLGIYEGGHGELPSQPKAREMEPSATNYGNNMTNNNDEPPGHLIKKPSTESYDISVSSSGSKLYDNTHNHTQGFSPEYNIKNNKYNHEYSQQL